LVVNKDDFGDLLLRTARKEGNFTTEKYYKR
jgi:hypothetical protein